MTRHVPDLDFDWDAATTVNGYFVSQQTGKSAFKVRLVLPHTTFCVK